MITMKFIKKSKKGFNILISLPFFVLTSVFLLGMFKGDPVGYFSLGLIFAAIFCDLLIIFGLISKFQFLKYSGFTWCFFCTLCLIYPFLFNLDLSIPDSTRASEYAMLILSFPSGLLSSVVYYQWDLKLEGQMSLVFSWGLFAIAGFIQWFVLIPTIVKRVKAKSDIE